ncbi:MAG: AraC family transcriptional regulator, partial [Clostridia bacterium]|nr:AraC family transcriptional regulator [Clostridia bacterium]
MTEYLSNDFLQLNSCGRQELFDKDRTMCRENGRPDYHILYIVSGKCYAKAADEELVLTQGQMLLFRPHERQQYTFYKRDKTVSCYIHFSGTGCEQLLRELDLDRRVTDVGNSHMLEQAFIEMRDEYRLAKPYKKQVCAGLLLRFLACAARNTKYNSDNISVHYSKRMDNVCSHMRKHYKTAQSVEFYAKMCSLSVDRFYHVFKQSVGVSPKQFMLQAKVDVARDLLCNTDFDIAEISDMVGIADRNYFSRLIKNYTGHTPSYFRT